MEDIFNTELGRKILALTKASFKVSDLISDLVFREKIKHQILEVYKTFFLTRYDLVSARSYLENTNLLKEIDILDHYFYLGGHLNLIKEEHLKQLRNGFLVFKSHIILANYNASKYSTFAPQSGASADKPEGKEKLETQQEEQDEGLNERQEKIMAYFRDQKTAKFAELLKMFSHISEKTVRNDLGYLISAGKLKRLEKGIYERK